MGLIDRIKSDVKKSGTNKSKLVYVKEGEKVRVRFLQDMDDGLEVVFHDSYEKSITVPCRENYGKSCDYCEAEGLRTRSLYVWSVWDYEAKEVKLFLFPINNCSPMPALIALFDSYQTLVDRDYVLSVSGKAQNKTYSVVPMDKAKFRNEKAKPYSHKSVLNIIDKAYPDDEEDAVDDDFEDEKPAKKSKPSAKSKSKKVEEDEKEEELDYYDLEPIDLFKLCKKKDIECQPKKPAKYYIKLLEDNDENEEDWGEEEDEEDEWED